MDGGVFLSASQICEILKRNRSTGMKAGQFPGDRGHSGMSKIETPG
jgi:hypothetical protein